MTKEMQELLAKRDSIMNKFEKLSAGTDEYKANLEEAKKVVDSIKVLEEKEELEKVIDKGSAKEVAANKVNGFDAIMDVLKGKPTNGAQQLIQGGDHGENYLIPEDVSVEINRYKRELQSAKVLCTVMQTDGIAGSFNFDVNPTQGLVSFDDGDVLDDNVAPRFVKKNWTIAYKGAFIPLSDLLKRNNRAELEQYLRIWFAERAVISENADIFAAAKAGYNSGTAKSIADWKALKSSINKDLDPSHVKSANMRIVTNQSGFDSLDSALDENGRPMLTPNPADPTQKLFNGHPVLVFSDAQLPNRTVAGAGGASYAPVIYGDTNAALWYIENPTYQFASDDGKGLGFTKVQTILRVLEGYTVFNTAESSYIYGEITL